MKKFKKPFGIDIGTTYSTIAINNARGGPQIVKDSAGRSAIPSMVSFLDKDEIFQGSAAEARIRKNASTTIYDTKRMFGQRYTSPRINMMKKDWSFNVEKADKDEGILIDIPTQHKKMRPYEVTAELLKYLIDVGNTRLPRNLKNRNAVITVPAYFSEVQREETRKAAKMAGITVLRLLNEPTAAGIACAYVYDFFFESNSSTALIYDFGGDTLNVSLLKVEQTRRKNKLIFTVKAIEGDNHLGGRDFDEVLLNYATEKLKLDKNNKILMATAREAIINAKIILSVHEKADIIIDFGEKQYKMKITRSEFENISKHLIQRCLLPVQRLLENNNLEKSVVDQIILTGGSSHMPFVKNALTEYFDKEPFTGIDPQEAVAQGASIIAYKIMNDSDSVDEDRRDDLTYPFLDEKKEEENKDEINALKKENKDKINALKKENAILKNEIQELKSKINEISKNGEKVKQLEEKNKKYENYLASLKGKSSELTFFDHDEYEEGSVIGEGGTSSVKIVSKKEKYAKKELFLFDYKSMQRFLGECELLFKLRHPCIIRVYGFNYGDETHKPSMILSLEPKSLDSAIKNKELNCEQKNRITVELVLGMRYIHKHKFMHRDLKPLNILLSKNNHVRITDFGLAKEEFSTSLTKEVGSLPFMAPELFNNEEEEEESREIKYTNKIDVYSFGIILIFIITDKYPPFNLKKVVTGILPRLSENISKWARELIISCLSSEPENRPSFSKIFEIMKMNNFDLFSDSKNQNLTSKQRSMKNNIEARIAKIEAFEFQNQ